MKKVVLQAIILAGSFFLLWWGLMQVDWMGLFQPDKAIGVAEEKLGDFAREMIVRENDVFRDTFTQKTVDSLLQRICKENGIADTGIEVLVIRDDQVNAFALPGRHLVLTTGILLASKKEQELCGVIAHEMAHMEANHVMKKLGKEIGFSVLMTVTSGGGGEVVREMIRLLSSTSYDRNLEEEADLLAVDYLVNAGIDPLPFSDLMYRIAQEEGDSDSYLDWVSTHPNSEERASYILDCSKRKKVKTRPVLSTDTWPRLRKRLE